MKQTPSEYRRDTAMHLFNPIEKMTPSHF